MLQTEDDLPDWFDPIDASSKIKNKFGRVPSGALIRLYFTQFDIDQPAGLRAAHIWAFWLPGGESRFFPDPCDLQSAHGYAVLRDVELKTYDVNDMPDEFFETVYLTPPKKE